MTTLALRQPNSLSALLRERARHDAIRGFLESMSPSARVDEAMTLSGSEVARLYRACADARVVQPEDFVPADAGPNDTVVFQGRNSLPLFSGFQKRFARTRSGRVVGYNHQTFQFATGPGFFVVEPAHAGSDVPGELYFDYTQVPEEFPREWPGFRPNASGLSHLVYKNMKDYMRHVADGVVVGEAYKLGKRENAWFVLARRPQGS